MTPTRRQLPPARIRRRQASPLVCGTLRRGSARTEGGLDARSMLLAPGRRTGRLGPRRALAPARCRGHGRHRRAGSGALELRRHVLDAGATGRGVDGRRRRAHLQRRARPGRRRDPRADPARRRHDRRRRHRLHLAGCVPDGRLRAHRRRRHVVHDHHRRRSTPTTSSTTAPARPSANADISFRVDYDSGAQSGTLRVPVGERSDLRITKYISPPVADAGTTVSYGIDVDNLGPSTARDVAIAETILGTGPGDRHRSQGCVFSVSPGRWDPSSQFDCNTGPAVTTSSGPTAARSARTSCSPIGVYPGPNPGDPDFVGGRLRAAVHQLTATEAITLDGQAQVRQRHQRSRPHQQPRRRGPQLPGRRRPVGQRHPGHAPRPRRGATVTYTVDATNSGPSDRRQRRGRAPRPGRPGRGVRHHPRRHLHDRHARRLGRSASSACSASWGRSPGLRRRPSSRPSPSRRSSPRPPAPIWSARRSCPARHPTATTATTSSESVLDVGAPELAFNPVEPARLFDTRTGAGGVPVGRVSAGTPLPFTVVGINDVPPGAEAVALNVTVTAPLGAGWLAGVPRATTRSGELVEPQLRRRPDRGQRRAGAGRRRRQVCFLASADTHVIADISGWFRAGDGLTTMTPVREFDTRNGTGGVPVGRLTPGALLSFDVTGVNGVPASGVAAVILNVTAAQPLTGGHLTVFPAASRRWRPTSTTCPGPPPRTSSWPRWAPTAPSASRAVGPPTWSPTSPVGSTPVRT